MIECYKAQERKLTMEIKKDWFWGTMYGGKLTKDVNRLLKIEVDECHIVKTPKGKTDGFIYVWGWPGPDSNYYKEGDYGITWAWELEDFGVSDIEEYLLS